MVQPRLYKRRDWTGGSIRRRKEVEDTHLEPKRICKSLAQLAETIRKDFMEEKPMWPFSSYSSRGGQMSEVGIDKSFEELRYEELRLLRVERRSKQFILSRTYQLLEQQKSIMNRYYEEKCGSVRREGSKGVFNQRSVPNGGSRYGTSDVRDSVLQSSQGVPPVTTRRANPHSTNAFGIKGSNGVKQSSADFTYSSANGMDMMIEENSDPPVNQEEEDVSNNQWLAEQFSYIPDGPPPEKYIS